MQMRRARRRRRRAVRTIAVAAGAWGLGCGDGADPPTSDHALRPARYETLAGLQVPPRVHDDGSPDACALLGDADPAALLGAELGPAMRVYGLCQVAAAGVQAPERSVGLEIRRDRAGGVPRNLDEFLEREGGGVGLLGGSREQIEELEGHGDYALWFPIDGGLQLFSYWDGEYILVLTIRGVPTPRALPWARELARSSVRRTG